MKIRVEDIKETGRSLTFPEDVEELNQLLCASDPVDYQFVKAAEVSLTYYRCGEDLFFDGHFAGRVSGTCARCLEVYPFEIERDFAVVLKPAPGGELAPALSDEDESFSFYAGDEVDLSPLVREELLLALPTRPLCREECAGLCPRCGKSRAAGPCECREDWVDPRLAPLRGLKVRSR